MVVLTDASEEESVNINDWLINQNLARQGKLVRTCDNFPYLHYARHNNIVIQSSAKISDMRNEVSIETRYEKDQLISCDGRVSRLSNDYSRNENEVSHDCEVSFSKQIDVQLLRDINALETKSSDKKLELNNYSEIDIPKGPKGLNILLEKLKTLNMSFCDSDLNVCTPEINDTFQDSTRLDCALLGSNMKIDIEIVDNNKSYESPSNTCFMRDDDEARNFETFKSIYSSHDLIQPIDWSMIKKDNISSSKTALMSINNSDILIKEHKNDVAKDKAELHNQEKDELLAKSYFLNMTHKEEEYFLAEENINYDIKDVSQTIIKLRNRIKTCNDKYMTIAVTRKVLEELHDNVQFQNTSFETNIVTINNISFSTQTINKNTNISEEISKARLNQEIENKNSATDWRLISSKIKNNKENSKKESQKTYKNNLNNSSGSNTINKRFNNRYQKLLKQIKCNVISDLNFA